jgi:hypothetical protein
MPAKTLSVQKIRNIIILDAVSKPSLRELARVFRISKSSVGKYLAAFNHSSLSISETRRLGDNEFLIAISPTQRRSRYTAKRDALCKAFPAIHQSLTTKPMELPRFRGQLRSWD